MKKYPAPALYYGLKILDIVSKEGNIGFSKIQGLLNINATSLNRYIQTLVDLEYIEKINGKYFPGVKLALFNTSVNVYDIVKRRAEKYLVKLRREFNMSCGLFAISNKYIYCLAKEEYDKGMIMPEIGVKNPPTSIASAWGMIRLADILKNKSEIEIKEYMFENHYDAYSGLNKDRFFRALKFTVENGYSDNKNTSASNFRMFAFPVYDSNGNLICSLAASSSVAVNDDSVAQKIIERLREYSNEISLS